MTDRNKQRQAGWPHTCAATVFNTVLAAALITAMVMALTPAAPVRAASLYQGEGSYRSLTSDKRAYRVGDMLTVLVVENSSASANANTSTEKSGGLTFGMKTSTRGETGSLQLGDTFGGKGQIQRSGRLLAQLSVIVREVDAASGTLSVAGEQQILVNDEKQEIKLYGKVRPIDILDNNTVLSTRLAEAHISYIGDGILSEKQHPGLLTRLLGWLGIL
ncbi:flagellar basal body L-ring protein FlgH [Noviherbaspirillum suwonense]|uniref:Flagellar L-ring protein FlgH n=1 Tax=Noviherbaspirillum suwonense TaxID=1224511 RepID=A0ABY1QP74_9BURK|nr:flagellar basal body L-ring protein FlgH [Noviherbaspirillum suwonense]SMP74786.1 flagellar L-ring protein precursor FlgH [Noviherbaspirillum suwonense]